MGNPLQRRIPTFLQGGAHKIVAVACACFHWFATLTFV